MHKIKMTFAILAVVLACLWAGLRWFEHASLYYPESQLTVIPKTYGLNYIEVVFPAADGKILYGWFIPAKTEASGAAHPTVLFFHGNAGNISDRVNKALILHNLGANVFLFDYRGYGTSHGRPSEKGLYSDGEGALKIMAEKFETPSTALVLYGESLGSGVAVEMAARHPVRGLILESPFTSVADMARHLFPSLPLYRFVSERYDNLAKIGRVKCPLLILHSWQDEIVPHALGKRLYEAAPGPKAFSEMQGTHNDGYSNSKGVYTKGLSDFFNGLK